MTATLFACPFRELLAGDLKTVLDGEIAEPDFWAAVCVSGARLIDDLRDSLTPAPCYASMSQVKCDPLCQKPAVQPLYQGAEGAITPLTLWQPRRARASPRYEEARFAMDSPLEGGGFELPVPRTTPGFWPISTRTTRRDRCRKKGVRIRQLLVCAVLGREWWARRRSVLSVSDPRERAAREPAGADRAPSSPSSARCASNRMLPAPGCVSRRS